MPQPFTSPFRKGKPLRANALERLRQVAERCQISVAPPLELQATPAGFHLAYRGATATWAKISGAPSGGGYSWVQQVPTPGGGWTDGLLAGTHNAYELNGAATVPDGTLVELWAAEAVAAEFRFCWSACS